MKNVLAEQFNRDGYVVVSGLFSHEEVQSLKREIAKVLDVTHALSGNTRRDGVFVGLAANSEVFKGLAQDTRLVEGLRGIIGERIIFLSDKVVFENSMTTFASPWHQDWPYWKGSQKYSVWIALDDATVDNGCLKVIPGSHLHGEVPHLGDVKDDLGFDSRLQQNDIDESAVVDVPIPAGDAIIFHDLLFHASHPNRIGGERWALISTYKDGTQPDPEYDWAKAAFQVFPSQ